MASRRDLYSLTATLLLCLAGTLGAQGTITGRITAEGSGKPVGGARVIVLGTSQHTTASDDGRYTLRNVRPGPVELQALSLGYRAMKKSVTVDATGTTTADFTLTEQVTQLPDVMVTSTGQLARRVELGNAVSTLGDVALKVETQPIQSITDLMIAKTPGVVVLPGGAVGQAPTIRIRGVSSITLTNAPIWVVDGVRYLSNSPGTSSGQTPLTLLNNLSPEEIQDIEIVKGPSAATLYGTNAANGVVVVTTKKGRAGKARWNYSAETRSIVDRNTYQAQAANWGHSPASPTVNKRCQLSQMNTGTFTAPLPVAQQCVMDSLTYYDPFSDPSNTMLGIGRGSLFGMNVSGGTEMVRFFASGDVDSEFGPVQMPAPDIEYYNSINTPVSEEMLHPRRQQKMNFRSNLSATVSPKLDINVNAGWGKSYNALEPDNSLIIAALYTGQAGYGYKGCPATPQASGIPIPADSGNFCGLDKRYRDPTGFPLHDYNSFAPGSVFQYYEPINVQRFTGGTDANWHPLGWLETTANVGIDWALSDDFHVCRLNECPFSGANSRIGNVNNTKTSRRNLSTKLASTATWQANDWANLKTTLGIDYTNEERDATSAQSRGLPPGASALSAGVTPVSWSATPPTAVKTFGTYVQEQLAMRDRLFLILGVRQDENSAFGSNFQSVLYPKASASWVISDESFFPKYSWLDNLRVRTAYGANGVQPNATDALQTFSATTETLTSKSGSTTTGTDTPGLRAAQPGNSELKPERSAELEAGFETDLLNRRIHFEYTYYDKRTHDALIDVPIASSAAASQTTLRQNIGSTRNWGHELQVNAQVVALSGFAWDVTVSGSHNSNRWLDLGIDPTTGVMRVIGAGGTTQQRVGYPLNAQWYKPYTYNDANGDGIIQQSEVTVDSGRVFTGYNSPRDLFSIQNGFDLFQRRLRINAMFDYKGGYNTIDGTNNFDCNSTPYACPETQDPNSDLWRQARAAAATYGSVVGGTVQKTALGYYMSGQFWRFRELSAVYQLPRTALRYLHAADGANLTFGVRNIKLWSKFTGIDPEANYGLSGAENQNEFNSNPQPTYFTLRLNLKY
jgi:TonB-linked SusC/RagA family outer membrane protein